VRCLISQLLSVLFAASVAALASHWLIDVSGDYLVDRDTYDTVAHGSRSAICAASLVLIAALALRFLFSVANEARGERRSLGSALSAALPPALPFAALVSGVACALVAAMEGLDVLQSGTEGDDAGDLPAALFGGSLWLGGGSTLLCSLLAAWMVRAAARYFASVRHAIVAAVAALLAPSPAERARRRLVLALRLRPQPLRAGVLARRAGKRAPPQRARHIKL
jgi:hypothetical protein